jgi:hypothetical protein
MTEHGTIKIPRAEYERHNQRRQDMGLTWAEYIDGEAPELASGGMDYDDAVAACRQAIREELPVEAMGR